MSICRTLCNFIAEPNANPSHLHSRGAHPILPPVKSTNSSLPLSELRRGEVAEVAALAPDGELGGAESETLLARLRDLGFVAGARCEVVARMWLGGNPLAVRIGGSTFALRRAEAAAVRVQRVGEQPRGVRDALDTKEARAAAA
jgi:ferrous iron transport protein A